MYAAAWLGHALHSALPLHHVHALYLHPSATGYLWYLNVPHQKRALSVGLGLTYRLTTAHICCFLASADIIWPELDHSPLTTTSRTTQLMETRCWASSATICCLVCSWITSTPLGAWCITGSRCLVIENWTQLRVLVHVAMNAGPLSNITGIATGTETLFVEMSAQLVWSSVALHLTTVL